MERFLAAAGFERAPWLAVAFGAGIAAWFGLANRWQWLAMLAICLAAVTAGLALLRPDGRFPYLRQAIVTLPLMAAAGCLIVWGKSEMVGTPPIARPMVERIAGRILDREERPADGMVRLLLATHEPGSGRAIRVRVNLPSEQDSIGIAEGARIRFKARLMPPAPPALPGGYNFARTAWFSGLSATGSVLGPVEILKLARSESWLGGARSGLSHHIRAHLPAESGSIAAALASGDRGAIGEADAQAMRDAGLAHLLSISGLHVSAVVAGAYFLLIRSLALWPWLALRVRLPLAAAGGGALAGIFYTLLTGAEVPTVRSCIGAVLVLGAMALGRSPLSLRLLAVAAFFVMLFWPEAVVGPSFQLSFTAVLVIIALHASAPFKALLAPREEGGFARLLRQGASLLITGFAIEFALMPIGLFHFHRSGVYGAFANVIAIPLTTFVTMPLIALALALDLLGLGGPGWWLAGESIDAMLALAHWVASRPGAVTVLPAMGIGSLALFLCGGLWLALWQGRIRLLGLLPAALGALSLALLRPPDVLITGDGRHVAITGETDGGILVLRESRSSFVRDNLSELAGIRGEGIDGGQVRLGDWSGAQCSPDFCVLTLRRDGRDWSLLLARGKDAVPERALAAACDRSDIVIADRWLPRSCRPAVLKADRRLLSHTGGMAIRLDAGSGSSGNAGLNIRTVAGDQGEHGWWRPLSGGARSQAQ